MSDDRTATQVWLDWFAERNNKWFGLGDAGSGPYCQCEAAISCDSRDGERQAFLFSTYGADDGTVGWFMVLDTYTPDNPTPPIVEWLNNCHGLLHAVTRLADFVATLVPSLADAGCPGLAPSKEIIDIMVMGEDQARAELEAERAEAEKLRAVLWDVYGVLGFDQDGREDPPEDVAKRTLDAATEFREQVRRGA